MVVVPVVRLATPEDVSSVGYRRKCQTSTATPAEPGELSWGLDGPPDFSVSPCNLRRAAGKFRETLCFPAGRRNFRHAVGKSGGAPEI